MPRPERPLDPSSGPLAAFAADLRALREAAGSPKYLQMARQTGRSRTALAEAAGGDHLPTWETVEAYVRACGGDLREWSAKWERVKEQAKAGEAPEGPDVAATPETPPPQEQSARRTVLTRRAAGALVGSVVVTAGAVPLARRMSGGGGGAPEAGDPVPRVVPTAGRGETSIAFSRFGIFAAGTLATGGAGGVVTIHDTETGRPRRRININDSRLTALAFDPMNVNILATGGAGGVVRIWDTSNGAAVYSDRCDAPGGINVLAFDRFNRGILAMCGAGGAVQIWNWEEPADVVTIPADNTEVTAMEFDSLVPARLATGGAGGARTWDGATGRELEVMRGVTAPVSALAVDPFTKNTLAIATTDGRVGIWDSSDGHFVRAILARGKVTALAFHPLIRNSMATGDAQGRVRIWDPSNGLHIKDLPGQEAPVTSLTYASDGQTLASGGADGRVRLWPIRRSDGTA